MTKGRHVSRGGSFYRDLAMMVLGILLVGAAVFLLLVLFVGDGTSPATTSAAASPTTTSSAPPPTTAPPTTTTTVTTTTTSTTLATTTSSTIPVRSPEEVRVVVLNSIGISGVAGRFTQVLSEAGYQTLQADDYSPEQDPSRIWYREGFSAEANVLLEFLPEAVVEPLSDEDLAPGADVIVVLGAGYEE